MSIYFTLVGCTQSVPEDKLIGGTWIGVTGYENDKSEGAPNCYPFHDGIEFKSEEEVYNATYQRDFKYHIRDKDIITFLDKSRSYSYQIEMMEENKIALKGLNLQEGRSCILGRK